MHSDTKYKLKEIQEFISLLKGKQVLDLCSGEGHDADYFGKSGLDVVAVDLSIEMIEKSRNTYPNVKFKHSSMMDHIGEYDGIWSDSCFPYLSKEDVPSALRHVGKLLKKEGVAMISFYIGNKKTIFHSTSEKVLLALMKQAGLRIVSSKVKKDWIYLYLDRVTD